jgi:two-component system, OmpR family, response regulator
MRRYCRGPSVAPGRIKRRKGCVNLRKETLPEVTAKYHRAVTQVLLADDDVELSAMLTEYLEREGFSVSAVHDGEAAARLAATGAFQIVVLDVMMPRMDGVEALRRIRQASRVPVIMLTARGDDVDRIVGLELGADDYVTKPCTPRELAARLRAILRRVQPQSGTGPVAIGELALWPEKRRVEWRGQRIELTSMEFNVLEVLMRNAGRIVSKKELSEQALGRPHARFERSVDVHLSSIRHKLGEGAALIRTVRGMGYHLAKD